MLVRWWHSQSGVRRVRSGSSWDQISHDSFCQMLRKAVERTQAGQGAAGGVGSIECRAVITLYSLLMEHEVNQWGHCRCCRRPGSLFGARWRPCQVYDKATWCLKRIDEVLLLSLLADE